MKILHKAIPKFFQSIQNYIDKYYEPKNKFGLTAQETYDIVSLAKINEACYDQAQEVAVTGHDLKFSQFDELMASYPLKQYSLEDIQKNFSMTKLHKKLNKILPEKKSLPESIKVVNKNKL